MTHQRNLYEILEISPSATTEEIKNAYRLLAMRWHPDRNKSPDAEARFKEINYAYSVLSDPKKRADYDAGLRGADSGATFSEEDAARVFLEEMFDLALHLAQAGYDENYIYRALVEEGCPGTIAAAAAKSACKNATRGTASVISAATEAPSYPQGPSQNPAQGNGRTWVTQTLALLVITLMGTLIGTKGGGEGAAIGGACAFIASLLILPSLRRTGWFIRIANALEEVAAAFVQLALYMIAVMAFFTNDIWKADFNTLPHELSSFQWLPFLAVLVAWGAGLLAGVFGMIVYRVFGGRQFGAAFVILFALTGFAITGIWGWELKTDFSQKLTKARAEQALAEREKNAKLAAKNNLERTITRLESEFPEINPKSPYYRQEVVDAIILQVDTMERNGAPRADAFDRITRDVMTEIRRRQQRQ